MTETLGLSDHIDLSTAIKFIRLASALKPRILHSQTPSWDANHIPAVLPDNICMFLAQRLGLPLQYIDGLWDTFNILVWLDGESLLEVDASPHMHDQIAIDFQLCGRMLYPAIHICDHAYCNK
ncbi:hypothetical protein A0H81_08727 [Grifola frondosa]|uniref:Uncharacterized protein n=1 Tax=Grifola frondosa TaxID=5627 RepID=A0A1C7M440_GRIFR|nr:hypothetical protein A0H81_08727 [Grifola frondosa]